MLQAILIWTGAVLGMAVLLLMALGPVIVEIDSWWFERKHSRRARKARKTGVKPAQARARGELARV